MFTFYEILGSHGDEYEVGCHGGCCDVYGDEP
jgi:hypothetical protein